MLKAIFNWFKRMREPVEEFSLPPSPPTSNSDSDITIENGSSKGDSHQGSSRGSQMKEAPRASSSTSMKRISDEPEQNRITKKAKSETRVRQRGRKTISKKKYDPAIVVMYEGMEKSDADGSSQSNSCSEEEAYEVESILDYWIEPNGTKSFLIKWLNWEEKYNTWELSKNLDNCDALMEDFYFKRVDEIKLCKQTHKNDQRTLKATLKKLPLPPDPRPFEQRVSYFFMFLLTPPVTRETLEKYEQPTVGNKWPKRKVDKMLTDAMLGDLTPDETQELKDYLMPTMFKINCERAQLTLRGWEYELNSITEGKPKISVQNTVDCTGPPRDFTYINGYVSGNGVNISNDPLMGCDCEQGCFKSRKSCCPSNHEGQFAYSANKRILVPKGTPIYECNKYCKCDMSCPNRVVQDGVSSLKGSHFLIFRTDNGKGWGVKTLKPIKKGEFVAIYAGEVITTVEADERGKGYDRDGMTYLFDLDINETDEEECKYVVDAKKMGNISHFFNHSCDPNLVVYNVFVNCIDRDIPMLALFATRDIKKGEEVTFDYMNQTVEETSQEERPQTRKEVYRCLCGTAKCRQFFH